MHKKIIDIVGFAGSVVSIISFLLTKSEWNFVKIITIVALALVFIIWTYYLVFYPETKTYYNQESINNFMKTWIKTDGVVKVLSRDLSWVDNEMLTILQSKGKDLYLYVEKENEIVNKIKKVNTECSIFFYGKYGFEPKSRYTIIHANKDDRQVALALQERRTYDKIRHEIYISKESTYDKKLLGVATDLMNYIECMERND